jgi:hypothetical protein
MMLAREDFVARLFDEFVASIIKPLAIAIGDGRGLF